jgi:hypothetical protein
MQFERLAISMTRSWVLPLAATCLFLSVPAFAHRPADLAGALHAASTLVVGTLQAAYGFEEGSGTTAVDSSGNANDGTILSGAARNTNGRLGDAIEFNGGTSHVDLGPIDVSGSAMSIALWLKPDDFDVADARLVSKSTGTAEQDSYWMLSTIQGPMPRFRVKTGVGGTTTLTPTFNNNSVLWPGRWTHVAGTYDGANMRIYVNGVLVATAAKTGTLTTNNVADAWIGRDPAGTGAFDGILDEVRLYDHALTVNEIVSLMSAPAAPPVSDSSAPTTPTGLDSDRITKTSIELFWSDSTDDFGVSTYSVLRNGVQVATPAVPRYTDTGLSAGTTYTYTLRALDPAGNQSSLSSPLAVTTKVQVATLTIDVWYGTTQNFGTLGVPTPWINILGNVQAAPGRSVTVLNYRLNGGSAITLNRGPDTRRLADPGDFNCDIATSALVEGANTVLISAQDNLGATTTKTVTVNFTTSNVWPLPYTIDWGAATDLEDVVQPVDGNWEIQDGHLRSLQLDYDRLVAIGEEVWDDYEVTVPITILGIDESGYAAPSNNPGIGVLLRWPGHTANGAQPHWGFLPLGAIGWYQFRSDGLHRLQILGNNLSTQSVLRNLSFGVRYIFKMRVETNASGGLYRFRVWKDGDAEPGAWDVQMQEELTDPQDGCLLLVAHHVDALYGNLTVTPLDAAPQIVSHPQTQSACQGSNVTFSVTATGTAPLTYQWFKNGSSIGGATSTSLTLSGITAGSAGTYHCFVTNTFGDATSNAATLTVNTAPTITAHPTSASPCSGGTVTLSVTATGGSISYQWMKNGSPVPGATAASLSFNPVVVGDAGTYRCDVSNSCGTVSSNNATITVLSAPAITTQPASQTVCPDDTLVLSVVATGSPTLTYQWRKGGSNISGATSASLVLSPADAGDAGTYSVVVTNGCGTVTSSNATVTVRTAVDIFLDPTNQSAAIGGTATFSVGANGTAPLDFQWQFNGTNISGATNSTLVVSPVDAGDVGSYLCVVTNACGSETSVAASLSISGGPVISTQPLSQSKCVGQSVTFTVVASGTGTLSYQWREDASPIAGATSASFTIPAAALSSAGLYDVVVTDSNGSATSDPAVLSVAGPPSITTHPAGSSVCEDDSVSLAVIASGGGAGVWWNVAWRYRLPIEFAAGAFARTDRIALVDVDFTTALASLGTSGTLDINSLRVIEIDASLQILDTSVPFQFDPGSGFNAASNAVGTVVVLLEGTTAANSSRRYHVYFETSGGFPPPSVTPLVAVTSQVDEGQDSFRVATQNATYYYHKQGGGFSSLDDVNGNDWIDYHVGGGSGGEFRGIPNLVFPGGFFHPGFTTAVTTVTIQGPLRIRLRSESNDGNWTLEWDIYPRSASMRLLEKASNYWFLYEGTPGGLLEPTTDIVVRSNGTQTLASVTWDGDISGDEWVYFGDPNLGRSIFVAHHTNDSVHDSYRPMDGLMTVFGFGRQSTTSLLSLVPDQFTIGLIDTTTFATASTAIQSAYKDLTATISSAENQSSSGGVTLTYQWRKGAVDISGATAPSFTIPSASPSDSGTYDVVVSSPCGSVTSSAAIVTVTAAPAITLQPTSRTVCPGDSTSFQVTASGTGLVYQWRRNGTNIGGASSPTLTLNAITAANAGSYDVVVSGNCGSVTSSAATLTVRAATQITSQPGNQGTCAGESATFMVVATGSGTLVYQWRKNGTNLAGATSASYSIPSTSPGDTGSYSVVVTGDCGPVTSNAATLSVGEGPAITAQPSSVDTCSGQIATFTVAASGSSPTFQWRKDGVAIAGATGTSYTIAAVSESDEGSYDVVISSSCGSVTSNAATLSVGDGVAITTQPSSAAACTGTNVAFSVGATGSGLSYQWSKNGSPIAGATSSSLSIAAVSASDAGTYRVVVSSPCSTATSSDAILTVNTATLITTQPIGDDICEGDPLSLVVTATGTSLGYQWRRGGTPIAGATSASLVIAAGSTTDAGNYDVVVTGSCGTVVSATVPVTVGVGPDITTSPTGRTICSGSSLELGVVATGAGLSYQWRRNGVAIPNAIGAVYSVGAVDGDDAGDYDVIVSNSCGSETSSIASVSVGASPVILLQPNDIGACEGDGAVLSVTASESGLSYQWRKGGVAIAGATSSILSLESVDENSSGAYDVVVSNSCGSATSAAATVSVATSPVILVQPSDRGACDGDDVALSVAVNGSGATYQWRKDGASIAGATSAILSLGSVDASSAGAYDVVVTSSCGTVTSAAATLSVATNPLILVHPSDRSACEGDGVVFSVAANGSGLSYQWRKGGVAIVGATSAILSLASIGADSAGDYDVIVNGTCGSLTSQSATLAVALAPAIETQPEPRSTCEGGTVVLEVSIAGTTPFSVAWRKNGTAIPGADSATFIIENVGPEDVAMYDVVVVNDCGSISSDSVALSLDSACSGTFVRGDANQDLEIDISDAITILNYLFRGGVTISCLSSIDANDDGGLDIAEAIFVLSFLFRGGLEMPLPNFISGCGADPTPDALTCESYPCA